MGWENKHSEKMSGWVAHIPGRGEGSRIHRESTRENGQGGSVFANVLGGEMGMDRGGGCGKGNGQGSGE